MRIKEQQSSFYIDQISTGSKFVQNILQEHEVKTVLVNEYNFILVCHC